MRRLLGWFYEIDKRNCNYNYVSSHLTNSTVSAIRHDKTSTLIGGDLKPKLTRYELPTLQKAIRTQHATAVNYNNLFHGRKGAVARREQGSDPSDAGRSRTDATRRHPNGHMNSASVRRPVSPFSLPVSVSAYDVIVVVVVVVVQVNPCACTVCVGG